MKSFRYISSFVVGLTVGAGAALLLTPESCRKIQRKMTGIGDRITEKVGDLKDASCCCIAC